ncbi:MAG: asparaginase, partial [Anaerolineales bacterium]
AKPFQAIPLVESGAAEAFRLTPRELALACASHRGLEMHVEAVAAMQMKIGVSEEDLLCGTHPPEDPQVAKHLHREGLEPTPNRHNCSGKHTGMLAQAKHRGLPLADYINPSHRVQQSILSAFAEMCSLKPGEVVIGIDGCSAPNFAVPLLSAATAYARLADPRRLPAARALTLRTIFAAMTSHPDMVRAPGGFDTELMHARPGVIVAKGGAEGYYGMGVAAGALSHDSPGLGIALKIADGAGRAVPPVALEALRQLGILDDTALERLAGFGYAPRTPVKNRRGLAAGEMRPCFELIHP